MKVILLGPPGAGKGTQASAIAESFGMPRVSSGDLFREHRQRDTHLGRLAGSYMARGALVPDDVTIKMVMEWINAHGDNGEFLLDGFPRTLAQAEALDGALSGKGSVDKVLYIRVSQKELLRRLTGRLICRVCQAPYHLESAPPKQPGKCDLCGSELYQRDDDKAEAIRKRIAVYLEETAPLIEYYGKAGILQEVDGESSIENVGQALIAVLS